MHISNADSYAKLIFYVTYFIFKNKYCMKNFTILLLCSSISFHLSGQIPDLQLQDTLGNFINLPDHLENNKNYGLIFWSALIPPSLAALDDYHNHYEEWNSNHNIEFLIVNVDESDMHNNVIDYVNDKGWDYILFFSIWEDVNQAFGINSIPYLYLINMNQEIVFEAAGYLNGELFAQEISQLFPSGLNDHFQYSNITVSSDMNNIIIRFENPQSHLLVSIFSMDGKLLLKKSYENQISEQVSINTTALSNRNFVIVMIKNDKGTVITRKLLINGAIK